ncbi:TIR domain-containing protein [Clostridium sp. AM58-1XD]|uniref:TIR domain-containing protein n=1 Tax=Clostridium sp. AM58-1XD TaxID=2292307 RepID=UPI000E493F81|nr:TIR domain-containing protein [Clostridium sp. AM58-1XD]RGY95766.1 TIR domain-containing protein [Clostridium sp. AM58-1XD]
MDDRNYIYDAFISYRHRPVDKEIAIRLQSLLENYHPPKGIKGHAIRIFRDQSELPTSNDLGSDIRNALEQSNYLIVICSEATRESHWCMEEIRQFKALHGGATSHILPLLVDGEPGDIFPDELKVEAYTYMDEAGILKTGEREVEPLCADVRADTLAKQKKLLRTEFLRLAAPILNCSFDSLYQRQQRRKTRRLMVGSLAALTAVTSFAVYSNILLRQISGKQEQLLTNESKSLSFYSEQERKNGDLRLAMLLARQALPQDPDRPERPFLPEAETALRSAVTQLLYMENGEKYYMDIDISMTMDKVGIEEFSTDESRMLVSDETTYYLYDMINGMLLRKWDADTIAWDPDLRYVLSGENNMFSVDGSTDYQLTDTQSGEILYTASFVPSSGWLGAVYDTEKQQFYLYEIENWRTDEAFCSAVIKTDGSTLPVDTADPDHIQDLVSQRSHYSAAFGDAFPKSSSKGTFSVAYSTDDRTAHILDTATGKEILSVKSLNEFSANLSFSKDEKYLAVTEGGNGYVYRLPTKTDALCTEVFCYPGAERIVLSYDNSLLAVTYGSIMGVYRTASTKLIADWENHNGGKTPLWLNVGVAHYYDTNPVFDGVASFSDTSPVFYVQAERQIAKYRYNSEKLTDNGVCVDGELILSDSGKSALYVKGIDGVSLYDTAAGKCLAKITGSEEPINYTIGLNAFHKMIYSYRNGKFLYYTHTQGGKIAMWDGDSGVCLWEIPMEEGPVTVGISEEGDLAVCGMADGTIEIRSATDGAVRDTLTFSAGEPKQIAAAGGRLLVWNEKAANVYDLSTCRKVFSKKAKEDDFGDFYTARSDEPSLTPDGFLFLKGGSSLSVYNLNTGTELLRERDNGGSYCYSPQQKQIAYRDNGAGWGYSPYISLLQFEDDSLVETNRIYPQDAQCDFEMDSSGDFICLRNGNTGFEIYSLPDGIKRLGININNLALRGGRIYDLGNWDIDKGSPLTSFPYLQGKELLETADNYLNGGTRPRELTQEEKERFFISE